VAGLNIPIENISDIILKKSKQKIEESIDQSVNDNFSVRQKMKENMAMFDQPMLMDSAAWLNIKPEHDTSQ
jgi:uncharacterized membrane-anchored protein YjiN (DUF445 family)